MVNWIKKEAIISYKERDSIIEKLCKIRGIEDIDSFLNPKKESLINPFLLGNIDVVSDRIIKAIENNERICVSMDCDADGIFSTVAMIRYLLNYTKNIYLVYNERSVGRGIEEQLNYITDETDLLIVIDSSTNSVKASKEVVDRGIDLIILDHHTVEEDNPHALIVNPQLCSYPNKQISGAGVVFKVIQVMEEKLNSVDPFKYIDLIACGMYADMMDVSVPENRYIIAEGMKNIKNLGLQTILMSNDINLAKVDSSTIGFKIAPLINGMARLDKIKLSVSLLLTDDVAMATKIVEEMMSLNNERKKKLFDLFNAYLPQVNPDDKIIIVSDEMASKGFNGVVANKIAEVFQRPAVVMRNHKGSMAGSYRSFGDFPAKTFFSQIPQVDYALGHEPSGGIGFKTKDIEIIKKYINEKLSDMEFTVTHEYDLELDVNDITIDLVKEVEAFNFLTGNGFPQAKFKVNNVFVNDRKVMGKNKDTIKIMSDNLDLLKFNVNEDFANDVECFDTVEVVGTLNINEWYNYGKRQWIISPQVFLQDYHKC